MARQFKIRTVRYLTVLLLSGLCLAAGTVLGTAATVEFMTPLWNEQVQAWLLNEAIPRFEAENPGITVQVTFTSWTDYDEKLAVTTAAGLAPDVFVIAGNNGANVAAKGFLLPIDEFVDGNPAVNPADFLPGSWAGGYYDGVYYSVPHTVNSRHLFYRKDRFEEAGLDANRPPATWDELLATVPKLSKYDGDEMVQFPISGNENQLFEVTYLQAGGDWSDETGMYLWPQRDAAVTATRFLLDLQLAAYPNDEERLKVKSQVPRFTNGEVVMFFTALASGGAAARDIGDDAGAIIGIAPATEGVRPAVPLSITRLGISRVSRNPEAAWRFIEFMLRPENLDAFNGFYHRIPPHLSLLASGQAMDSHLLREAAVITSLHGIEAVAPVRGPSSLSDWTIQLVHNAVFDRIMTPEAAVDEVLRMWYASLDE